MRTIEVSCDPITTDVDGICLAQAPGSAGNLTINGVAVIGAADGTVTPANVGGALLNPPRPVTISSAANDTARTFTVYGFDRTGAAISESIAGANAGASVTSRLFATVTRIAINGAAAGNVTAGWNDVSYSAWMPIGQSMGPAGFRMLTVGNDNEGANMHIETTSKNVLRPSNMSGDFPGDDDIQFITDTGGADFSTDVESVCLVPYAAVRLVCTANSVAIKLRINPNYTA